MTKSEGVPMWMENLEEWIMDENRVVSAKYLSRALNVHVNIAKERLFHFVQDNPGKSLEVVYFVSGKDEENQSQVRLVKESGLESLGNWKSITSKHFYAVGKKEALGKDNQSLLLSLMDAVRTYPHVNTFNAIVNKKAVPRTNAEVVAESPEKKKKTPEVSNNKEEQSEKNKMAEPEKIDIVAPTANKKGAKTKGKSTTSKGSGAIAGMFAKQKLKDQETCDRKRKEPEVSSEVSPETSPGKENRENEKKEKTNNKKNATRTHSQPKRKRIQMMSDSDSSDDDLAKEEEEDASARIDFVKEEDPVSHEKPQLKLESSSEEEEDTIPQTPEVKTEIAAKRQRRRRGKKLVEKTFTDEQGFMVTKKEYESYSESGGEEEEEEEGKKVVPTKIVKSSPKKETSDKKKNNSNAKKPNSQSKNGNKQASIMNFFKKK